MKQVFLFILLAFPYLVLGQNENRVNSALEEIKLLQSAPEKIAFYDKTAKQILTERDFETFVQFDKEVKALYPKNELLAISSLQQHSVLVIRQGKKAKAIILLDSILSLTKGKYKDKYVHSLLSKSNLYNSTNEFDKSKQLIEEVLKIENLSETEKAEAYMLLGALNGKKGMTKASVVNYLKADSFATEDSRLMIRINQGLAYGFRSLKDYKKALVYGNKASQLIKAQKDTIKLHYFNINCMASIHQEMGNNEAALKILESSNSYFKKIKNSNNYYVSNMSLGMVHNQMKNPNKALPYINETISFKRNSKDPLKATMLVDAHLEKARSYALMGLSKEVYTNIDSAKYYIKDYNSNHMEIMILKKEIATLEILGDLEGAYLATKKMNSLNWEIDSLVNYNKIQELEEIYQSQKKEAEIVALKAQSELDKEQKKNQRNLLFAGIAITSLLGLFFFFLYRNRQKTSDKLKEIDTIKTRFFENISHEFRTPLTLIKLPVSRNIKTGEPLTDKNIETIHNNASRLQNLVEDLLSLSELDAGKMTVNKTEQNPIKQAKTLASQFDSYASSKGIKYTKLVEDKQITALYDKSVLDKVVTNLISNAIKYSSRGDEVTASISRDNEFLFITVSDTGAGISEEDQTKIFDRFYQIGEKDEANQGSGIGLALVKKILEINQATITVESKLGEGSTFKVRLPLEKIREIIEVEPEVVSVKQEKIVIKPSGDLVEKVNLTDKPQLLIVEDNEELSDYLFDLFKDNFEIEIAANGQEGLERAIETVPNIILSDWMMPKMNGVELCGAIKTNSITSHIPFVLLTAKAEVENKIEGYETGADAYFSKPFDYDELKAQLTNLLNQRKLLLEKFSSAEETMLDVTVSNSRDIAFWEDFKNHLEANIRESELSAISIAEALSMSRMQLHRKLTALTGQTVGNLIKNQRMQLAKKLLKDPAMRVSDVCFEVGFTDKSAFSRAFKKEFGVSPSEFKKENA